jgi:hypothetical protein
MTFDQTKHVRVRRSAGQAAAGNLVTIGTPKALTLCDVPANQRPFPVIRSDEGAPAAKPPRIVRAKRSVNPVLGLTFPAGTTEDDAVALLATFEMSDYTLMVDEQGAYTAIRSDLQSIATETTDIKINKEGVVARVDASQYKITRADSTDNLRLVALEFDAKRFDADAISSWIAENKVDSAQDAVENADSSSLTVKRHDVAEGTEVRKVQLEDGVTAVIARSDVADVPAGFAVAVNETMYGNWGWGHLDFNASMADVEFCRVMDDANYRLMRVLNSIMLDSQLPLEQRKALVDRALSQYGDFVKNVIDALPRQVTLLVTRAAVNKENETMAGKDENGGAQVQQPLTREDVAQIVQDGITAAFAARSEAQAAAPAAAAATTAATTEAARDDAASSAATAAAPAATETVTRADIGAAVAEALKPFGEQLAAIQNTVVVRSDSGDRTVAVTEQKEVKRGDTAVFGGLLAGARAMRSGGVQ